MSDCVLILADGAMFSGESFGAPARGLKHIEAAVQGDISSAGLTEIGEVVFNTAMSGYAEVLTDPSYTGQIVVMTYPHIGNYGIDSAWSERGPDCGRTREVQPAGLVVRDVYRGPVRAGRISLDEYLRVNAVPGISGVDTRALTLHLREHGAQNGIIVASADTPMPERESEKLRGGVELAKSFPAMEGRGLVGEVGTLERTEAETDQWSRPAVPRPAGEASMELNRSGGAARTSLQPAESGGGSGPLVALLDCGTKANIVRELVSRGCRVTVFPADAAASEILESRADAVMLSNGPGDPAVLQAQVDHTRELIGRIPVLGVCLGHQIIAEALGGRTGKMKFGHHGVNHPVRDEITRRVFVTSQNHGFTVDESSLPEGVRVWFRNANDGTVEGLRDERRRIRTTQFHPESAPGPADAQWIFDEFLRVIHGDGEAR